MTPMVHVECRALHAMHPCHKHIFIKLPNTTDIICLYSLWSKLGAQKFYKTNQSFPNSDTLVDIRICIFAKDSGGVLCLQQFWQFHKNVYEACSIWLVKCCLVAFKHCRQCCLLHDTYGACWMSCTTCHTPMPQTHFYETAKYNRHNMPLQSLT